MWNIEVNDFTEAHARLAVDEALAVSPRPQIITFQEAAAGLQMGGEHLLVRRGRGTGRRASIQALRSVCRSC
jgi:hypothetical protein